MKKHHSLPKSKQKSPSKTTRYRQKQRQRDYRYKTKRKIRRHHRPTPRMNDVAQSNSLKKQKKAPINWPRIPKWVKYYTFISLLVGGGILIQEFLSFKIIENDNEFKLQVHSPWYRNRTFQLSWGEEVIEEEVLPAYKNHYLDFEKELIQKADQTKPYIPVVPTVELSDESVQLTWEAAQPYLNCKPLRVTATNELLGKQREYCVKTPISHYELRKGHELIQVTQGLEMEVSADKLEIGVNEFEWVVVNENGLESLEPITVEYYPFEIDENYQINNPTPYKDLTYEIWKDKQWETLDSNDLTSYLHDSKKPKLTEVTATPYSWDKQIRVTAVGEDTEEAIAYDFKINYDVYSLYANLETTYQSKLSHYEAGWGKVGEHLVKSETGHFTFSSLEPGTYQVWVRAVDKQGNVSEPVIKEVVVRDVIRETITNTTTNQASNNTSNHHTSNGSSNSQSHSSGSQSSQKPSNGTTSSNQSTNNSTSSNSSSSNSSSSSSNTSSSTVSRPSGQKADQLYSMTTCYSGVSTNTCYEIINAVHRVIPAHIVQTLYNNGSTIDLMPNNIRDIVRSLTGWDAGWNYHGVTFFNSHGQKNHIFTSVKGGRNIFIHEIGHLYDYYKGVLSSTDEFNALYQAEKGIFTGLYASSSIEFFAETFRMYITEPSNLSKKAPKTYAYMKQLIG